MTTALKYWLLSLSFVSTGIMTVARAASTAFATPVASPVNTLVLGPRGYRFNDFVKVGVPLQFLAMIVTLLAVPVLFPL